MQEPFVRHPRNPLITTDDLPYLANAVFNAGAVDLGEEVLLLLRVESCSGHSHLIVARSKDGVTDWKVSSRALLHADHGNLYEANGVEDCRITRMVDPPQWALAYTAYGPYGPGVALATTTDFTDVRRMGLIFPPDNKNATLFPRRFNGLYAILHRPCAGGGSVWISFSPDLRFWGDAQIVLAPRGGPWWDGVRVGAGLPPIETDEGWLLIYHGVKNLANAPVYRLGAVLLDIDAPQRVIARTHHWLLSPREPYERMGDAANVVFAVGGFVRNGELWTYYGAADASICLARAKLADVIDMLRENGSPRSPLTHPCPPTSRTAKTARPDIHTALEAT